LCGGLIGKKEFWTETAHLSRVALVTTYAFNAAASLAKIGAPLMFTAALNAIKEDDDGTSATQFLLAWLVMQGLEKVL
ncbi:hypothetical protein ABTC85_21015, partial [Acinetobacter baumannii]